MNPKREHLARYIAIGVIAVAFAVVFAARLINIEVTGQGYVEDASRSDSHTRTEPIYALRGEIRDRNGKPLVTNSYYYVIYLDAGALSTESESEKNSVILRLFEDAEAASQTDTYSEPSSPFARDGEGNVGYDGEYMETVYGKRLKKLLAGITEKEDEVEAETATALLCRRYGLTDKEGKLLYGEEDAELLFRLRLDMELHNFSVKEPYTLFSDVSDEFIALVKEDSLRGAAVKSEIERVYNYPGVASHLLGRTGKIQPAKADYYKELGYSSDATVGISGAEEAFEEYLHGEDGEKTIIEDEYGNVIDEYVSKEPVPGKNVLLTIDIDLQAVAEEALKSNIETIIEKAESKEGELDGEDADAGALTVLSVNGDEVLAAASYPTYDLSTFDEDYKTLSEDSLSPMFNRALEGTYAPGSTFKPGVAAAALQEGIINTGTLLPCDGQYKYYESSGFVPACWIWNIYRGKHGPINVTDAIQVSCNCFFYETGRLMSIQTMNRYCKGYGLGQATGIELPEKTGVLAGPEYREENGLEAWTPGQTITAAIGQSDNLFTPLQMSLYVSTLINGGTRYKAHFLYEVREFYTDELILKTEPEVADDSVSLSPNVVNTVLEGMRNVTENGSAATLFKSFPIAVGGKTGTAQVTKDHSDNAVFTAFAPFSSPEITATCVIERGANGTDAGYAIRDVFSQYFGIVEETADAAEDEG